jgi:hypothetical protein
MANQKLLIDVIARDKTKQALGGLQKGLAKVRGAVFNVRNAFIGLGAGLVVRNLVNTGKELENLRVRLRFLLKDTNEGAKAFDNMVKFASKVPFSLEEIQSGSGILATITDNAEDLKKMLEITGNVAAVTGLDFRTTAEQIQRSFSAGIGAADLFREKGVRNMLGFQAGAQVSIEATAEAFEKVFGKNGRFGKATDDLASTFTGTLSMIGDKIFSFKKTILEAGFFEGLKTQFGELDKFLEKNAENIDNVGRKIGVVLAVSVTKLGEAIIVVKNNFGLLLDIIKGLIALKIVLFFGRVAVALMNVAKSTMAIAVGTSAIKSGFLAIAGLLAIKGIDKLFDGFLEDIDAMERGMQEFQHELSIATDSAKKLEETFDNTNVIAHDFEHELSVAIPSATQKMIEKFRELNKGSLEEFKTKIENIRETIAESINEGISKVSNSMGRAVVMGEKLGDSLKRIAQDFMVRLVSMAIEITLRLAIELVMQKAKDMILAKQLEKEEKKASAMKKQTSEMKKQAILSFFTGGSGGGFNIGGSHAQGGAVAKGRPILVGERGAEVFVPNSTGQIVQHARGQGGGGVNVNFTINTIDSRGFGEALQENRGTITGIINNALAEKGRSELI